MIYLTKGYLIKEFETRKDALNYIKQDLDQHNLTYNLICHQYKNGMEIYIYQYHTLYMETYIIHKNLDLRKWSYIYE